jgi:hypothetical protein
VVAVSLKKTAGAIQQTKFTSAVDYVTSFLPGGKR